MNNLLNSQLNSLLNQYKLSTFLWELMRVLSHRHNQALMDGKLSDPGQMVALADSLAALHNQALAMEQE